MGSGRDELAVGDDGEADGVKYGLPLAFVTIGQKVPDDIVLPDAHAIASRILSAPLL